MKLQTRSCTGDILHNRDVPYSPLTKRVLAARGINSPETLDYALKHLHPVNLLGNVQAAAELLAEAVVGKHQILIVGDYDADGATATALIMRALTLMGHQQVTYLVPGSF